MNPVFISVSPYGVFAVRMRIRRDNLVGEPETTKFFPKEAGGHRNGDKSVPNGTYFQSHSQLFRLGEELE